MEVRVENSRNTRIEYIWINKFICYKEKLFPTWNFVPGKTYQLDSARGCGMEKVG